MNVSKNHKYDMDVSDNYTYQMDAAENRTYNIDSVTSHTYDMDENQAYNMNATVINVNATEGSEIDLIASIIDAMGSSGLRANVLKNGAEKYLACRHFLLSFALNICFVSSLHSILQLLIIVHYARKVVVTVVIYYRQSLCSNHS